MPDGVSVVIPSMHAHRFRLLEATLASLSRCRGVEQIIIAEMGGAPHAAELAAKFGADHVFTHLSGSFDRSRMLNAGAALARGREILWTDGDFLFEPDFIARAQREMRAGTADYFYPHSMMHYLGEHATHEILAGRFAPHESHAIRSMEPRTGNPGGMGMVSAAFLDRHGGMVDGFRGWGCEDHAWLRKVSLLGQVDVSHDPAQRVWHLFHPDSGSHSEQALREAARRNPHYTANLHLMSRIWAVHDGDEFLRHFPKPNHLPAPWPAAARIVLAVATTRPDAPMMARAIDWATRLRRLYATDMAVLSVDPARPDESLRGIAADAVVGLSDDSAGCHALMAALGPRLKLLVADVSRPPAIPYPPHLAPMVAARTPTQIEAWCRRGVSAWHLPWNEDGARGRASAPPIVAPLSNMLGASRMWKIRIELDRAEMPPPALNRPRFWYVGLHDADHIEIARQDVGGAELLHLVTGEPRPIVIERAVTSPLPPATWTIWPTDRQGRWLDKLTRPAEAEDLGHRWA